MKIKRLFKMLANLMVYYGGISPYVSIINFGLLLGTFKQAYNLDISSWILIPGGIFCALSLGFFDYRFVLPYRLAKSNRQNDIKNDVNNILLNQKLILERLK